MIYNQYCRKTQSNKQNLNHVGIIWDREYVSTMGCFSFSYFTFF